MISGTVTGAGPSPRSCRKADLSLALGAAGLVLGFLLLFAILTPAAIATAVGALKEIRVQPALRGKWRAWTGIGLALVAPVLWVSAFLAFAEHGTFGIV
ncbi:MAG: hypothetical protein WAL22_03400 [Solirubrobacteraceae bacterium]